MPLGFDFLFLKTSIIFSRVVPFFIVVTIVLSLYANIAKNVWKELLVIARPVDRSERVIVCAATLPSWLEGVVPVEEALGEVEADSPLGITLRVKIFDFIPRDSPREMMLRIKIFDFISWGEAGGAGNEYLHV